LRHGFTAHCACADGECGVDAEDQCACHCSIGEVVVGGGDDRQQRDRRVRQGHVAPTCALDPDEHQRDQQRPSEVQRGHRRELVGDRLVGVLAVDAGAIALERVDEPVVLEHSRWRQGIGDVDRERGEGDGEEPVAEPRVHVAMADDDPADEGEADREVDEDVVVVQELDQAVEAHCRLLQPVLAEHVQVALDTDDLAGVFHGGARVVAGQVADLLVAEEHGDHDDDLANGEPATGGEAESTWH